MDDIVNIINRELSACFQDYHGLYFYGSRMKGTNHDESDYDLVLIFDYMDYAKKLEVSGVIGKIEYKHNVFVDIKIMTQGGESSPENIRKNINPAFIDQAVDNGIFYDRQH